MAGETILLVEDNQVLREGLKVLLEQERYAVVTAKHGKEALQQMAAITPDLILSDIIMPELDGYGFFEAVRANHEWISIPFIFLTARRDRRYILAGRQMGAEDYLLKPVSPDELLTAIRSRLARSQELLLAQIENSYEASLIMLANAIEVRDAYTRGHVERVMNFAVAIAEEFGWSKEQIHFLKMGCILHDVGKIHIPETVLKKKGPLTEAEWVEMKRHPISGADLVKDIHYLAPAIPVILYHHERWNGKGYPEGLAREAIPLAARIIAVADSFDAMTTLRPYRGVLSPEQACQEIRNGSGSQYDPGVVEAFMRTWEAGRIHEIFERFP